MNCRLCALCVDNVAAFAIDAITANGSTGDVTMCFPCAADRLPLLLNDLATTTVFRAGNVTLGNITAYTVRALDP
jgi:hypothetical protein